MCPLYTGTESSADKIDNESLKKIVYNSMLNFNTFLEELHEFNKELKTFENDPNSHLETLLKYFKYLTIIENFIDSFQIADTTSPWTKLWHNLPNIILGVVKIYIALTGKNLQRIVSNFPIDGKEHDSTEYLEAIFLNLQNYAVVLVDVALSSFLTAHLGSWALNIIFKKSNDSLRLTPINFDNLYRIKAKLSQLVNNDQYDELIKFYPKMLALNKFVLEFKNINKPFIYHPKFNKEVKTLEDIISKQKFIHDNVPWQSSSQVESLGNSINSCHDSLPRAIADSVNINFERSMVQPIVGDISIEIDEFFNEEKKAELSKIVKAANQASKNFMVEERQSLSLINNYKITCKNLVFNASLEIATWFGSHVCITGASLNTTHANLSLKEWITEDIFKKNALIANVNRYLSMRPINYCFKSGMERLNISTSFIWDKFDKLLAKQGKKRKIIIAILSFVTVSLLTNIIKTYAALVTETDMSRALDELVVKLQDPKAYMFFGLTTLCDMITFNLASYYQDIFSPPLVDKIYDILTNCGKSMEQDDRKIIELTLEKTLPTFTFQQGKLHSELITLPENDNCQEDITELINVCNAWKIDNENVTSQSQLFL